MTVSIAGPTEVRQGDVVTYTAEVRRDNEPIADSVAWSLDPASAGLVDADGRFVGYTPGPVQIVARVTGASDTFAVTTNARDGPTGTFSVVGNGPVRERFTSDLWVHGSVAYAGTFGRRQERGDRLYVWDIGNPAAPFRVDSVVAPLGVTTVNDVKVGADGKLVVMTLEHEPGGIVLLDAGDPLHPTVHATVTQGLPSVHNVWVEGNHVYAAVFSSSDAGGLHIFDATDPANPVEIATFFGGVRDSPGHGLHDVYVRDGLAFLSHWDAGLVILDVGNGISGGSPQQPVEVGRTQIAGGHVHNAWYWPEAGYVFVGQERNRPHGIVHVVDARDLGNPSRVATFGIPGSSPHNFWLDEDRGILYVAWYDNGLRAIDVTGDLLGELDRQGREISSSFYDRRTSTHCFDSPGDGTCPWAPQLHEGLIYVSDLNSGLWVLRPEF